MIQFFAIVAVLASAQNAAAPAPAEFSEPRQISEEAMKFVAANDMKGLFGFIGRHMPMEKKQLEDIESKTIEQRKALPDALGKSLGYGFISECRKSDFLVKLTYVEKREKNVVRWQFVFYKPRNAWHMTFFYFDSDLNALFQPCS